MRVNPRRPKLMNPFDYVQRAMTFHGVVTTGDKHLKTYRIACASQVETQLPPLTQQQALLAQVLDDDEYPNDHGLGFVIYHFAEDGDYLLVSTWCDANMLRHRVFKIETQHGSWQLISLAATHIIACIWELDIIFHERNAWIEHVLTAGALTAKQRQAYLAKSYSGWV